MKEMNVSDIVINRDKDADVLYVITKNMQGKNTANFCVTPYLLVRVNPATKKIVGFTIENFSKVKGFHKISNESDFILMEYFCSLIESLNNPALSNFRC